MIMSNETTQKRSLSVSLGAAFLMATSAIGPGFLTQTSQFTAKYLSSFAFVIVCVIIMDMIAQTNVWSIVGVSGLRGQEIANKVLPGLGYLLVVLVVLGGLAFNIGNVGGVSLGFNAMIGIPEKAGVIIGGVLAICIFLSKKANDIVGKVAQILGGLLLGDAAFLAQQLDDTVEFHDFWLLKVRCKGTSLFFVYSRLIIHNGKPFVKQEK